MCYSCEKPNCEICTISISNLHYNNCKSYIIYLSKFFNNNIIVMNLSMSIWKIFNNDSLVIFHENDIHFIVSKLNVK